MRWRVNTDEAVIDGDRPGGPPYSLSEDIYEQYLGSTFEYVFIPPFSTRLFRALSVVLMDLLDPQEDLLC
jgi:hypothetical protein